LHSISYEKNMENRLKKSSHIDSSHSESVRGDLNFINQHFGYGALGLADESVSELKHSPFRKNVIVKVFSSLLQPYVTAGVRFRASVVRLINELYASREYLYTTSKDDVDALVHEAVESLRKEFENRYLALVEKVASHESLLHSLTTSLSQIDSVSRGLEALLSGEGRTIAKENSGEISFSRERLEKVLDTDNSYLLLENRYRGSEEEISSRMKPYAEKIASLLSRVESDGPVVEIGCGRGELLSLLSENDIKSKGIELDAAMVRRCHDKGLEVIDSDALEYLYTLEDNSLPGIVAIQVVEHLSNDYRRMFFDTIMKKVVPDGFLILETINTSTFLPLMQNYFRDPTHIFPLHPDTLRTLLEQSGLEVEEILYSSEFPEEAKIPLLPSAEGMTFRHQEMIRQLNERFSHLNRLIYGPQDYAIIARIN
jgi:2-polyprenyl-3-methyl-5-hydroxy-6-metoxy-1,4-benzoquinol methylase